MISGLRLEHMWFFAYLWSYVFVWSITWPRLQRYWPGISCAFASSLKGATLFVAPIVFLSILGLWIYPIVGETSVITNDPLWTHPLSLGAGRGLRPTLTISMSGRRSKARPKRPMPCWLSLRRRLRNPWRASLPNLRSSFGRRATTPTFANFRCRTSARPWPICIVSRMKRQAISLPGGPPAISRSDHCSSSLHLLSPHGALSARGAKAMRAPIEPGRTHSNTARREPIGSAHF